MSINRRDFIKGMFAVTATTTIFGVGKAIPLLSSTAGEQLPWFNKVAPKDPFSVAVMEELGKYPKGSVAHSVGIMELYTTPFPQTFLRGLSFGQEPQRARYFMAEIVSPESFLQNYKILRGWCDDFLSQLSNAWIYTDEKWWGQA